jgi:hypothetical protein
VSLLRVLPAVVASEGGGVDVMVSMILPGRVQ